MLVLCAATAVGGCGSSSSALSKSDLIAKGDAICKRVSGAIKSAGPTSTAADVAKLAPKVHGIEQQGVNDLRKLKPPSSLASDWSLFLSKVQVLTDDATKIGIAAKSNDQNAAQTIAAEASSASTAVTRTASKLGFTDCARQN